MIEDGASPPEYITHFDPDIDDHATMYKYHCMEEELEKHVASSIKEQMHRENIRHYIWRLIDDTSRRYLDNDGIPPGRAP